MRCYVGVQGTFPDKSLVIVQSPIYEVFAALESNIETLTVGRKKLSLVISDRVRRAVLEPLEPLSLAAEVSGLMLVNGMED